MTDFAKRFGGSSIKKPSKRIDPTRIALNESEHSQQAALFCYAAERKAVDPVWGMLYAVPNGGLRDKITAARLRAEGVKPGFPDIGLPVARRGFHGLFIEMKRDKGGRLQPNQNAWHALLQIQGYCVMVCKGYDEARKTIEDYLA